MANMSYCRFENTLGDFVDCIDALNDGKFDTLSERERRCCLELIRRSRELSEDFGHLLDGSEEEQ